MKKILLRFYLLVALLTMNLGTFAYDFEGKGTSSSPYLIYNAEDLRNVNCYQGKYFEIMCDIDLSSWITKNSPNEGWIPISDFYGYIDGKDHTISGLLINRPNSDYQGLFDKVSEYSTMQISNVHLKGKINGNNYIGGFIGSGPGRFNNCSVDMSITGNDYVGCYVGRGASTNFNNCLCRADIKANDYCGGFIGYASVSTYYPVAKNYYTRFSICHAIGIINANSNVGGICGYGDLAISLSSSSVNLDCKGSYIGGLIGKKVSHSQNGKNSHSEITLSESYAECNIIADGDYIGGLIGYDSGTHTTDYNTGHKGEEQRVDCYFKGSICSYGKYVGGLIGYGTGQYERCFANATIKGNDKVGGLLGHITGSATGTNSNYMVVAKASLKSCISLNEEIKSDNSVGAIYCTTSTNWWAPTFGKKGTSEENIIANSTKLYSIEHLIDLSEESGKGTIVDIRNLLTEDFYTSKGWDFSKVWQISNYDIYPSLRNNAGFPSGSTNIQYAIYNYNNPTQLSPSVIPSEEEDDYVKINIENIYVSNNVSLSFGLGNRNSKFCPELYTGLNNNHYIKILRGTTMTIEADNHDKINRVVFYGNGNFDDLIPNNGDQYGKLWIGYSPSVKYTMNNDIIIDSILVYYTKKHTTIKDSELYNSIRQYGYDLLYYSRSFSNTNWQALYVPFSMSYDDWKDEFEVGMINDVNMYDTDDNGEYDVTEVELLKLKKGSLKPNTPYFIKAQKAGEKVITLNNATLYPAEENSIDCSSTQMKFTFTGTYSGVSGNEMYSNGYYALSSGALGKASNSSVSLKPMRWYMSMESRGSLVINPSANVRIRVVGEDIDDEEATGIADITASTAADKVYSLDGRQVNSNNLKAGVYIKNGKKYIVK